MEDEERHASRSTSMQDLYRGAVNATHTPYPVTAIRASPNPNLPPDQIPSSSPSVYNYDDPLEDVELEEKNESNEGEDGTSEEQDFDADEDIEKGEGFKNARIEASSTVGASNAGTAPSTPNPEKLRKFVSTPRLSFDARGVPGASGSYESETSISLVKSVVKDNVKDLKFYLTEAKDDLLTVKGWKKTARLVMSDWKSAIVSALVGLPYCIALGVAAGTTPTAGVITCVWAGAVGALFAGCPFNIIGPSGALSGILSGAVSRHGKESLGWLAIYCGVICFLAFLLKLEKYVLLIPSSVVEGFTLGVAIILFLNQVNFALGLPTGIPKEEEFVLNTYNQLEHFRELHWPSLITFLIAFVLLMGLMMYFKKIPWIVALALIGIGLGWLSEHKHLPWEYQTLNTRYSGVKFELYHFPPFHEDYYNTDFIVTAVSVSFICILETLISAKIADGMTRTQFRCRKEMFAVSIANAASGAAGGFPSTASLPRTALNINSGATSRISALMCALLVCGLAAAMLHLFDYCPLPLVAAMICVVAVRMVEIHHIMNFWKMDKTVFWLTMFVAFVSVVKDPTIGIAVGMIVSLLMFSEQSSRIHSELVMTDESGASTYVSDREITVTEQQKIEQAQRDRHLQSFQPKSKFTIPPPGFEGEEVEPSSSPTPTRSNATSRRNSIVMDVPQTEIHQSVRAVVYRIAGQLTYVNAFAHRKRLGTFDDNCDCVIISLRYLYFIDIDGLEVLREIIDEIRSVKKKRVYLTGVNIGVVGMVSRTRWYAHMMDAKEVLPSYLDALRSLENERTTGGRGTIKKKKVASVISVSNY